ncbi:hypothetical protein BU16DRAFT_498544 [Lophium mytilinum]|uniref:Uncharacterized protein n=1 Tax=Lophium mytilinum TaxID=390894 RepID=A0A6A6RDI6_9PEZI|nr:hypothetical protein BU16DRAFT_498544 [Lophium mytilinum]
MSHQLITPSDPDDSSEGHRAESSKSLLSDPGKKETTVSAGKPSPKHSKLSSTWRVHWKTLTSMVALFLLAWIIAVIHLTVFVFLDRKRTDGPHSIPQSYVAALSHLLGLLFRATLCSSLTVAFTQCLWHLMRIKTVKISSIDMLFQITKNPFLLVQPEVVKTAPILFILALFTLLLPLAITFPPGALIVVPSSVRSNYNATVPTYNGSFMGNGSVADSGLKALANRRTIAGSVYYYGAIASIRRTGRLVLELDDIIPSSSPCGPDCMYVTQFEGPYLRCADVSFNQTIETGSLSLCDHTAFSASIQDPVAYDDPGDMFNISASRSIKQTRPGDLLKSPFVVQEMESLSCVPSRASYVVNVTYKGGLRTITRSQNYTGSVRDMLVHVDEYNPDIPECDKINSTQNWDAYVECEQYTPAIWSKPLLSVMTAYNHFALIDALISPLGGNYTMLPSGIFVDGADSPSVTKTPIGPTNGTIAADTFLNTQRDNFGRSARDGPSFAVSQDILNDALFNVTMSAALQLGFWNTTVPVETTHTQQVYSFVSPRTLIVPYLTCLLLSIPFLYLGMNSVRLNGVTAMQGGFLQILMTTTGSKILEQAAAAGCLGGEENVPEDLKAMEIRFGELICSETDTEGDGGAVKRAGFGTDDEVVPLTRGVAYGV